jgi:N-acetylneuraminic acid mutarotase
VGPAEGSTEMWWFDPSDQSWVEAPTLPHAYDHVTMIARGDDVYSIGGYTGNVGSSRADVFVLPAGASAWERRADLPVARGAMAGTTDGDRIFVAGGRSEREGTPSSRQLWIYDPDLDTWDDTNPDMPTGRDHIAGAFLDGVFWIIGGRGDGQRVSATPVTEGFDTRTGEWLTGAPPPIPTSANGLAVLDGRVVLFGGEGPASTVMGAAGRDFDVYRDTYLYDPTTDSWSRTANSLLGVHHPAYDVIDGVLYAVGGGVISGVSSTRVVQSLRLDA